MVHVLVVRDMAAERRAEVNAWLADPESMPETEGPGSAWDTAGEIVRVT